MRWEGLCKWPGEFSDLQQGTKGTVKKIYRSHFLFFFFLTFMGYVCTFILPFFFHLFLLLYFIVF